MEYAAKLKSINPLYFSLLYDTVDYKRIPMESRVPLSGTEYNEIFSNTIASDEEKEVCKCVCEIIKHILKTDTDKELQLSRCLYWMYKYASSLRYIPKILFNLKCSGEEY